MYLFLLMKFFKSSKFKNIFKKYLSSCFSAFTINFRMYSSCVNKVDNFKPSMLSSRSFICLALAVSYVLLYCCPLLNLTFFSTHCCRFQLRSSVRWILFCHFVVHFQCYTPYEVMCANYCIFCTFFFILGKVLVLSHAFCVIFEIHNYAQLSSFKWFRLYCVCKKADIL